MSIQVIEAMTRGGFEEVVALYDRASGLRAFLAIHDTTAGPAFGGLRRWQYLDEEQALRDCLRLARSMTQKCALASLPAGGAKLVLLDQPELDRSAAYRFVGRTVERMGGRFCTGPDVGTGPRELAWVRAETAFVTDPGERGPGDLASATTEGVLAGMAAALRHVDGEVDWPNRTIVIQGLGGIGERLARLLLERGARVLASEIDPARADVITRELGIEIVDSSHAFDVESDVFAPCAMGGILHDVTVKRLRARIVAGAANNVLARMRHGDELHAREVLYVPDIAINSGALILGAMFHLSGERPPLDEIERRIGASTTAVLRLAADENLPPARVALREAERRIGRRREPVEGALLLRT